MSPKLLSLLHILEQHGQDHNIPQISWRTAEILQFLVRIARAKKIFEVGCAHGFSTLFLAAAAAEHGGTVVSCDLSAPSFTQAQKNVRAAKLDRYVDLRFGDALNMLKENEQFDLVFIDGEKKRTADFFRLARAHLNPRGLIVIDDTRKFPEKMQTFFALRAETIDMTFCDIPTEADDSMTVCCFTSRSGKTH